MTTSARVAITLMAGLLYVGVVGAHAQATTLTLRGLHEPVEILRDRWGIAHIYARNEHDLFFTQGYSASRDRLFQFELWRRQATGTVAEILGRKELERDIGARLLMFRGDLAAELNWYHPRGEAIIAAFVDGVNAAVDQANRDITKLPLEFKLLGITPQHWTPAVVISRHNALLANVRQELAMVQAVRVLGAERVKGLVYFQGGDPDITPERSIDLAQLTQGILDRYVAFREPMRFTPDQIAPTYRGDAHAIARLASVAPLGEAADEHARSEEIGSNNWVIAGRLTQTGKPMMMNDPHRLQAVPSLRYWVHLVGPGWNVIGAGEPVLPGVSIGHNEAGAWGLTVFGSDSEDLYVYETNPANPNQYRYRGEWEDMRVLKDSIPVKGESPAAVELKYTRHGPVLYENPAHRVAYALRAAWLEIGSAPYLASLRMDQAKSWEEFREACSFSRIPSENMVWADVSGNIGYQAAGIAPLRPNWSGLVPVPGDGRYEWNGYLPIQALPHVLNPSSGFFVTANHYLYPENYPYKEALHYIWADPYRAMRITEVLASGRLNTVAEMIRLQNDNTSIPARHLVPLLRDVEIADPTARKTRDLLLSWDYSTDADSVPAGIYEMWLRRLQANVHALRVPQEAQPFIAYPAGEGQIGLSMKRIIDWLEAPDGGFGPDPIAGRNAIVARSLTEAVAELSKRLGPDVASWQWGQNRYHHALIPHALGGAVNAATRARLEVGPIPRGGDSFTVSATGGADNQVSGGSFKIIADTDNWDNSIGINNPGQSGDPDSPHYRDLFLLWARGGYFPVFFSRPKVESVTEDRVTLEPGGPTAQMKSQGSKLKAHGSGRHGRTAM